MSHANNAKDRGVLPPCEAYGGCPLYNQCAEHLDQCHAFRRFTTTANYKREERGVVLRPLHELAQDGEAA